MNFIRATLISFFVAVLTFIPVELTKAGADVQARADSAVVNATGLSISSGTFIAFATASPTGANPNGSALVLANSTAAQYFYVRNTGTTSIASLSITTTYSASPARTNFARCGLNVVFTSLTTCASGASTSITAIIGVNTLTLTLPPGSFYAFELDPKRLTTPTISVSVSSAQIRPATLTNS